MRLMTETVEFQLPRIVVFSTEVEEFPSSPGLAEDCVYPIVRVLLAIWLPAM